MTSSKNTIKLVFATNNLNKLKEVQAALPEYIQLLSLKDIGCEVDIPETSNTIAGNARMKADYIKEHFNLDCFADDTGLEVEALDGAPGVHSARYAGKAKDDEANIQKLLKELEGKQNRRARFKTVFAIYFEGRHHEFTGICSGEILKSKRGNSGFGYDPVFQPEGQSTTFAEMDLSEKSQISHRGIATRALIDFLSNISN